MTKTSHYETAAAQHALSSRSDVGSTTACSMAAAVNAGAAGAGQGGERLSDLRGAKQGEVVQGKVGEKGGKGYSSTACMGKWIPPVSK